MLRRHLCLHKRIDIHLNHALVTNQNRNKGESIIWQKGRNELSVYNNKKERTSIAGSQFFVLMGVYYDAAKDSLFATILFGMLHTRNMPKSVYLSDLSGFYCRFFVCVLCMRCRLFTVHCWLSNIHLSKKYIRFLISLFLISPPFRSFGRFASTIFLFHSPSIFGWPIISTCFIGNFVTISSNNVHLDRRNKTFSTQKYQ